MSDFINKRFNILDEILIINDLFEALRNLNLSYFTKIPFWQDPRNYTSSCRVPWLW